MLRPAFLPTLALVTAFSGSALAQTQPTTEQAHALEVQITGWLKQVTGGTVPLPARPVQLTPEADHYLVKVPLGDFGKVVPPDAAFTAKARPLDATRWALDDQQFPPELTFTTTEMVPDAPDAKDPSPDGRHKETATYHLTLGKQEAQGVFDPTYSTASTSSGTVASLDLTKAGGMGPSTTHIDRFTSQTSSQPVDPGHVNILGDGAATGYLLKADMQDGSSFSLNADRLHVTTAATSLAHDQLVPVIQSVIQLAKLAQTVPADSSADGPSPEEKAALRNLLTGSKSDATLEGLKFDFGGTGGSLDKVELTFGVDAPKDLLSADFGFTMDGLKVDGLPPTLANYVPTHFAIHPTVSNVSVAALTKMGMDATAPTRAGRPAPDTTPDMQALFANGGIRVGFDKLDLAVVGTTVAGTGTFVATGPETIAGQAEFTAHGRDGLITKMQADPMLAAGVPVVIFLKGIAKTTSDESVWQVSVNNTKVLVNGVDLSAMAGAMNK